jgi:hypothetical protein
VSFHFKRSLITDARCRCRMLESHLISCAHIFTVWMNMGAESIPPCCVIQRWTMRAKNAFPLERLVSTHVWSEEMHHFRDLRNKGNLALFLVHLLVLYRPIIQGQIVNLQIMFLIQRRLL